MCPNHSPTSPHYSPSQTHEDGKSSPTHLPTSSPTASFSCSPILPACFTTCPFHHTQSVLLTNTPETSLPGAGGSVKIIHHPVHPTLHHPRNIHPRFTNSTQSLYSFSILLRLRAAQISSSRNIYPCPQATRQVSKKLTANS